MSGREPERDRGRQRRREGGREGLNAVVLMTYDSYSLQQLNEEGERKVLLCVYRSIMKG